MSWQSWTSTGYREVHGVFREETALGYQLDCLSCHEALDSTGAKSQGNKGQSSTDKGEKPKKKGVAFATTNFKFWERRQHGEIPSEYGIRATDYIGAHCSFVLDERRNPIFLFMHSSDKGFV